MRYGDVISKHRYAIMGFAAWLIVWYHTFLQTPFSIVNLLIGEKGAIGVDIFVFLSGFGIAFSLKKKPQYGLYMKKRCSRMMPVYYAALLLLTAAMILTRSERLTVNWVFRNYIPFSVWFQTKDAEFWYVGAALLYYIAAPVFYRLLDSVKYKRSAILLLIVFFSFVFPVCFSYRDSDIALMRIPVFISGIGFGLFTWEHERARERNKDVFMMLAFAGASLLWVAVRKLYPAFTSFGLASLQDMWLKISYLTPFLVLILAYAFELLSKSTAAFVERAFERSGKYSLEIYLAHCLINKILVREFTLDGLTAFLIVWAGTIPVTILISLTGRWLTKAAGICLSVAKKCGAVISEH